jgi:hypothetical protein
MLSIRAPCLRRNTSCSATPRGASWNRGAAAPRALGGTGLRRSRGVAEGRRAGFLCPSMPEQYGGAGADKRYSTVLIEEQYRIGDSGLGFSLHSEIVAPYLLHYGSEHIKQTYLPKMASGEMIGAIAMTEPAAGRPAGHQDHRGEAGRPLRAQRLEDLHHQRLARDLVIVVAKTDAGQGLQGHQPVRRRHLDARLLQGQAPEEGRHEGAGHLRAVLRQRQGAGVQPARRRGQPASST